jgi:hypothetical protein
MLFTIFNYLLFYPRDGRYAGREVVIVVKGGRAITSGQKRKIG